MFATSCTSLARQAAIGLAVFACMLGYNPMDVAAQAPPAAKGSSPAPNTKGNSSPSKTDPARPAPPFSVDEAGVLRLLQTLVKATNERDLDAVSALIDSDRMFAEIERQGILKAFGPGESTAFRTALKLTIGPGLVDEGAAGRWKGVRIHRVAPNLNGPTTVVAQMLDKSGRRIGPMKFWMIGRGNAMKIFDWQAGTAAFRTSTLTAVAVAALRGDEGADEYQQLSAAARSASQGDLNSAGEILENVAETRFPDSMEAARWLIEAQVAANSEQPERSLECLNLAEKYDTDILVLSRMRSAAYADLGDTAKSLVLAEQSIKALGDDADSYLLFGNALSKLNRATEAVVAFQKGLDTDADSLGNLTGLAKGLPTGKKDPLITRFDQLSNRSAAFPAVADALLDAKDKESLRLLVDSANKWAIDEAVVEYYTAELMALDEKMPAVAMHFKVAIARATDDAAKQFYRDRLLTIFLDAKHPIDGYKACDDAQYALEFLVPQLLSAEDAAGLLALSEAHQERLPDDVAGYLHAGEAHFLAKHFDQADKAYSEAMKLASGVDLQATIRSNRLTVRFKMGQGLEAFQELGADRRLFDQLARLLAADNQAEALLKLVALQRKTEPEDTSLDAWEADAHSLAKDYASAIKVLKAALGRTMTPLVKAMLSRKLLIAQLAAKKPLEAYADASDAMPAFGFICDNLLSTSDATGLQAVIKAHRDKHPSDLRLCYYSGKASLLNKDYPAAKKEFTAGIERSRDADSLMQFSRERMLVCCKLGESMALYRESPDKLTTFDSLAPILAENDQADDLETLVKAHRQQYPGFAPLGSWEAEAHWKRRDYKGTVETLKKQRDSILADESLVDRFDDRLVRSLVRLKDFDEAVKAAQTSTTRDGDPWFEAVVYVAKGDVKQAESALKKCLARGYASADFEADADIGPAIKSAAFEAVRSALSEAK